MSLHSYSRAPHAEGAFRPHHHHSDAPNAALLIDFDNVTMGMRSDLSKELKNLLNSDIIRGKVTVQRAYADWRRYPQYIVPLSEASIDLIFAPAYGSSKKNATDIRMAIDGMELVFIRPEIGTYILLTGDSDFSSLVLKLKEYGKYVIGVGIQESSSDILVQNCDEYYSYTSITGLRKSGDADRSGLDPWQLVEKALEQMSRRNDVMRSDRLKQVMLELDQGFDEGSLGFSKFSRFLTEASSRGLVKLRRMENGQYELSLPSGGGGRKETEGRKEGDTRKETEGRKNGEGRRDSSRSGRSRRSGGEGAKEAPGARTDEAPASDTPAQEAAPVAAPTGETRDAASMVGGELAPLAAAYDLLRRAMGELGADAGGEGIRDSDVKRKMLGLDRSFDEAEYGFSKFSRFLRQAHDHEVVDLQKSEDGNYQVTLRAGGKGGSVVAEVATAPVADSDPPATSRQTGGKAGEAAAEASQAASGASGRRLTPRVSSRRGGRGEAPPPLLEGQVVGAGASGSSRASVASAPTGAKAAAAPSGEPAGVDPVALGLPTEPESVVQYLSNSYKGVGRKTAETLVEAFGGNLFQVLQSDPDGVRKAVPGNRAEKVLEGWGVDFKRRSGGSTSTALGGASAVPTVEASVTSESPTNPEPPAPAGGQEDGESSAPPRRTRGRSRRTRGGGSSD